MPTVSTSERNNHNISNNSSNHIFIASIRQVVLPRLARVLVACRLLVGPSGKRQVVVLVHVELVIVVVVCVIIVRVGFHLLRAKTFPPLVDKSSLLAISHRRQVLQIGFDRSGETSAEIAGRVRLVVEKLDELAAQRLPHLQFVDNCLHVGLVARVAVELLRPQVGRHLNAGVERYLHNLHVVMQAKRLVGGALGPQLHERRVVLALLQLEAARPVQELNDVADVRLGRLRILLLQHVDHVEDEHTARHPLGHVERVRYHLNDVVLHLWAEKLAAAGAYLAPQATHRRIPSCYLLLLLVLLQLLLLLLLIVAIFVAEVIARKHRVDDNALHNRIHALQEIVFELFLTLHVVGHVTGVRIDRQADHGLHQCANQYDLVFDERGSESAILGCRQTANVLVVVVVILDD